MTEQRSYTTQPLGFDERRSQTRPLGFEQGEATTFQQYLAREELGLISASQLTGVRTSVLWRACQGLPVSRESACLIRDGLRKAGRPYVGPIAIVEGTEGLEERHVVRSSGRDHKVMIGGIAIIYEGQDQSEAMRSFLSAIETFTDRIEYMVEKVPVR